METLKVLSLFGMTIVNFFIVLFLSSEAYFNKQKHALLILLLCIISLPLSIYLPIRSIFATPQTQRLIAFILLAIISVSNNLLNDNKKRKILWWIIGIITMISMVLVMPHNPSDVGGIFHGKINHYK